MRTGSAYVHGRTRCRRGCARDGVDGQAGGAHGHRDAERGDEPTAAHTMDNLVDRRHGRVSTAVTSNIGLSDWGRFLGDATLTAAILDRLAMHAIRIDIDGRAIASTSLGAAPPTASPRSEPPPVATDERGCQRHPSAGCQRPTRWRGDGPRLTMADHCTTAGTDTRCQTSVDAKGRAPDAR